MGFWDKSVSLVGGRVLLFRPTALLFPRTKRLHDERIGKRRCVHLFRLTLADEVSMQRAIHPARRESLDLVLQRREDALKVLESESREVISVDAGPVQIGRIEDAFTEVGITELAKHYFAAFRQEIQCLPYFAKARK